MISTEIYIENQRLDLYKDISAEFTYAIDDIKDFSSRNTNFSKTIVIPGNATNNKLFGHIFEFGSSNTYDPNQSNVGYNFNPSVAADCVVFVEKIQIFKGIIRLLEIIVDNGTIEYECAVFGELGGFVSAVSNSKLEDLDFSQYDHLWTVNNITGSWSNASGGAYYYPLIDYGKASTNKHDFDVSTMRPALFVKEYVDKIITGAGYTYESNFFETSLFKRLIVPNNQKQLSIYDTNQFRGEDELLYYSVNVPSITTSVGIVSTRLGPFQDISNYEFRNTGASLTTTLSIRCEGGSNVDDYETGNCFIGIYKNGTLDQETLLTFGRSTFDTTIQFQVTFATNDIFKIRLRFASVSSSMSVTFQQNSISIDTQASIPVPINYGSEIQINSILPKGVFQKDLFASIVKMFNLYVVESTDKPKHLIIEPFIDFYQTTPTFLQVNDLEEELLVDDNDLLILEDGAINYRDWTYKVDRAKPFRIKPMSELNGRYFEFKYKSDVDFLNDQYSKKYGESYGDRIEDTGFQFANDKQTAEIIFAASPLIGYPGEEKVFTPIYKISNTQNTQSEDQTESTLRIMQVKQMDVSTSWVIKDGVTTLSSPLFIYGYAGHLDDPDSPAADINFGAPKELFFTLVSGNLTANLYNGFWSEYIAEITDKNSKLLTCNVYLTQSDIYTLDFSKLIWIDGSLWRLNKVIDYNPMNPDTTKCEFLKVIELTYQ